MKIAKMFCISIENAEAMKELENKSELVDRLLTQHFEEEVAKKLSISDLDKLIEIVKRKEEAEEDERKLLEQAKTQQTQSG